MNHYVLRSEGSDPDGPYTREELAEMWRAKTIQPRCMIAEEGGKWVAAEAFFPGVRPGQNPNNNGWIVSGWIVLGIYAIGFILTVINGDSAPSIFPWLVPALLLFIIGKLDVIAKKSG